jgi:hypothetical protein
MKTLSEKQWAKIHGHRAGIKKAPVSHNPYFKNFNDPTGQLSPIWATARNCAIAGVEYHLSSAEATA